MHFAETYTWKFRRQQQTLSDKLNTYCIRTDLEQFVMQRSTQTLTKNKQTMTLSVLRTLSKRAI